LLKAALFTTNNLQDEYFVPKRFMEGNAEADFARVSAILAGS
jgi:hypothetical protein